MSSVDRKLTTVEMVISSLVAGGIAGALAKTTIAPLDRTKINFQISNSPFSFGDAINFMIKSYKTEGITSLWRGNSATLARIIPHGALQFTAHEQWKRILHVDNTVDSSNKQNLYNRFLAGSLAGVTSQSITYPLDLARARMAVTVKAEYKSLIEVFKKIYQTEGIRAFYKGYVPTILGVIPYAGMSFFTYGILKIKYKEMSDAPYHQYMNLVFGAIAGMLGQTSSYPLDIVRRRMQTSSITKKRADTILGVLRDIYREEGVRQGFFKGLSMNWIKGPIAVGISFATYDFIYEALTKFFLISNQPSQS
ncbi:hypothetical protein M8J75_007647 [Diaphorina citri]|nr:hypothetical protein M8J75_007647 [Diaphorina citri]